MGQQQTISVSLSPEIADQVRHAVESGEYGSASDVVGEALRRWGRERDGFHPEHLKAAWNEAVREEHTGLDPEPVFTRIRRNLATQRAEVSE